MKVVLKTLLALILGLGCSCAKNEGLATITVTNSSSLARTHETVALNAAQLQLGSLDGIGLKAKDSDSLLVSQLVDTDGDGSLDQLLFQPNMLANSEKQFLVVRLMGTEMSKIEASCFSRFVPERTDDYAWENDKVAFRTFGPTAQKMAEDKVPGGTLSSGVDAWLKRVDYPIINKWYKKELETPGTYHEDDGEGLDNFHVGVSRGVGGTAVKIDSVYHTSKNFVTWRTVTNGPIRTQFVLEYAPWKAGERTIKETKVISLDRGSHLSKFKLLLEGSDTVAAGLTLHEKDGAVSADAADGWLYYWQPHGDSELGTAILALPETFVGFEHYDVDAPDLSNAYAHLKVNNNQTTFYAGFAWKEAGQFPTEATWRQYLADFSNRLKNPLGVQVQKH